MELRFGPRGLLCIDKARITHRNFEGRQTQYNNKGDRNFSLVIAGGTVYDGGKPRQVDAEEMADILRNEINSYGVGWKIKTSTPSGGEGDSLIYMPVKVKYTERSAPEVYIDSNGNRVKLDEEDVHQIDDLDIQYVDLDIRPYDGEGRFGPHRTAYLQGIWVYQNVNRFAARFAEEEYPEE